MSLTHIDPHVSLFDLSMLHVFPQVVTDGPEAGVDFITEVTPESYGSFADKTFLLSNKRKKDFESHTVNEFVCV